ncbi:MAG: aminotransferase class I/II-fold pyridoxal phosphate-dependent enzyme [Halioglobus sp.]|nr:aminotransferase class I/II-fold pyridoxal phosphate-dependent enzyme [Halioglobus sp.]
MPDKPGLTSHLNLNVRGLPISATLGINERSHELIRQGRQIFKLGLGQSPFPVPEVVVNELRINAHQKDYLPVLGLPELRTAVADYYHRTQGLHFAGEDVMIGPGSKELMFILQLVYYGELVIPTPSWVSYAPQAHIIGRQIKWLETDASNHWKVTPQNLSRLCASDPDRPRLIILNYPSNPHGYTYSNDELAAIAEVAREYRMLVLADEIYGEVNFRGDHTSIAQFYPEGTIVSSGLSKWCGAGGWRLGTFAFPAELQWLKHAMATAASETYTSTSAPIQYAAIKAFQGGPEIDEYLIQSRRVLAHLSDTLVSRLHAAGFDIAPTHGGFYLFLDFEAFRPELASQGLVDSVALCEQLLNDTGVALLPGVAFGRPLGELTVRIAFVDFDGSAALAAASALPAGQPLPADFSARYCTNCVTAIEQICRWVAGFSTTPPG